nr:reverse transcriptase domain-containing protein [Tanacetum cinerariifolium]
MRTRSQSRNNFPQQEASPVIVEPLRIEFPFLEDQFQEDPPPESLMADNRTMAQLLQAPTEGYEDAIVIPEITANNFELKHGQLHRPLVNQAPVYQAPSPQTQRVSQMDFESYSKQGTKVTKDQVQTPSSQDTAPVQPSVIQSESQALVSEPVIAPISASMPNLKPSIPYPSRRYNEKRRDQANEQIKKFYEIFKDMSFEISFTDALTLMPKFASTLKALIGNKEKLNEMARTPMNEHCSAVILNKLPRKLGDPGKFLIPCEFLGMDERCFLKTSRALIDVHKGELTLHIDKQAITFNLDQTVELKDLPPHLEYTFLEGDNKFPVIIAKELGDEEKSGLIKVLKSHKRAIA